MKKTLLVLALVALPVLALSQSVYSAWTIHHAPPPATQATISKVAVPGWRHVATGVTVCVNAVATQTPLAFNLRDGASGAGDILWTVKLAAPAGDGRCVTAPGDILGSLNTAMTLESAAAPAASNFATVALIGYDTH